MRKEHENFITELESLLDKHEVRIQFDAYGKYGVSTSVGLEFQFYGSRLSLSDTKLGENNQVTITKNNIEKLMR